MSQVLLITNYKVTDLAVSVKMSLCLIAMMEVLTEFEVFEVGQQETEYQDFIICCVLLFSVLKRI